MSASNSPEITVSSLDLVRLEALLSRSDVSGSEAGDLLQTELDRAEVLPPEKMPPDVVTMNSIVVFRIEQTGAEFERTLCYSSQTAENAISVLAPVGMALLGLRIGQTIDWPGPDGRILQVTITGIRYQPERAGDLSR
ncbi:MAG: nucleoside diphosphate kinase regulator [Moraxellaceae bacterium]|nr:nucleoside diphosphate kinase regulator [Moraxellaceae bacterium]MDP1776923.1 nucleoside diphosphate kinase regulator [Moraxellaceae bacterium]MDZ4298052.1 nucleoside diphosphate kinase regulator [Moraxellaceae bacterium]MDZ4386977.1 nucleoside diphosphate kinase regulator [Moraxellaceae bacterium]